MKEEGSVCLVGLWRWQKGRPASRSGFAKKPLQTKKNKRNGSRARTSRRHHLPPTHTTHTYNHARRGQHSRAPPVAAAALRRAARVRARRHRGRAAARAAQAGGVGPAERESEEIGESRQRGREERGWRDGAPAAARASFVPFASPFFFHSPPPPFFLPQPLHSWARRGGPRTTRGRRRRPSGRRRGPSATVREERVFERGAAVDPPQSGRLSPSQNTHRHRRRALISASLFLLPMQSRSPHTLSTFFSSLER